MKKTDVEQRSISIIDLIPETIESFLKDRIIQNFTSGTIRFYRHKFRVFYLYCEAQQITNISQIDTNFMRSFFMWVRESHNQGGANAIFRACKTFFRWWELESGNPNPMTRLKPPKVDVQPLDPIQAEEIKAMLKVCNPRDKAIIQVLVDTGLRAAELLNIKAVDLKLSNNGEILIRRGKGGKPRSVFIGQKTRRAVRDYLKNVNPLDWLWLTDDGDHLTYWGLRDILVRRSAEARVKYYSPHAYRRAFAITMLRSGVDIYTLAKMMGHSDIQTLKRYLKLVDDDIQIAHAKGSPMDNL